MQEIIAGRKNREIAELLSISISTVKTHKMSIFNKFGVKTDADLIKIALGYEWDIHPKAPTAFS